MSPQRDPLNFLGSLIPSGPQRNELRLMARLDGPPFLLPNGLSVESWGSAGHGTGAALIPSRVLPAFWNGKRKRLKGIEK